MTILEEKKMKEISEVLWHERTREEIPGYAAKGAVVVVPIASIEQHGVALPVDTDCRTVEYVSVRAAQVANCPVLVTRLIPFGVSPHHMMHHGTITLTVETTLHVLRDVINSIITHGFDHILLLTGHGGNGTTIASAALEAKFQLGRQIESGAWWDGTEEVFKQVCEGPCPGVGHAGEGEGSCIMALSPGSVRQKFGMVPGITDDPGLSTAEKGWHILNGSAEILARRYEALHAKPGREVIGITPVPGAYK